METIILNSIKESTFFVTGCAGFIGSNLCEFLVQNNAKKVIGLDNLINGKIENINHLLTKNNFTFINGDIRNFDLLLRITNGIDYVFHQAAWGSVPRSIKQPLDYTSNNVIGTHNVFEASQLNKVKKVIYASSSSVYGDHPALPKVEGIEGNLINPYALSKKINEQFGKLYWDLFKLPTIGLRYFNVFGRRQNPDGDYAAVIPKFIKLILNDELIIVYGDGNQSRDFTFIDDVINANLKACFLSDELSYGKSCNIGSGQRITLNELIILLQSRLSKIANVKNILTREGDIKHSLADISLANKFFLYSPDTKIDEGLDKFIFWLKTNYK